MKKFAALLVVSCAWLLSIEVGASDVLFTVTEEGLKDSKIWQDQLNLFLVQQGLMRSLHYPPFTDSAIQQTAVWCPLT